MTALCINLACAITKGDAMQQSLIWHQHHVINCRQLCRLTVQAGDKQGRVAYWVLLGTTSPGLYNRGLHR